MQYRREIDGLRAVAVLPVILFHAGVPAFGGGFVGVDVFFVISGYLITGILLNDLAQQRFSIATFYERRARRILPALFVVMAACLPFAWLWLPPEDLEYFARSLIGTALFGSNINFWLESGYFDAASELKPLLHTWSLAVEEQFYLLFPLLLLAARGLSRKATMLLLAGGATISLALAEWGARHHPAAAFFLLPTRAWELAIGCLLAFHAAGRQVQPAGPLPGVAALGGLALIGGAIVAFDHATPFPGLHALAPVLGTALVLFFARPDTLAGRLLGSRVLVGIGLVSYSAYLWHQPLFAFARHQGMETGDTVMLAALVALTLLLAWLSWRYVEQPFRQRDRFNARAIALLALAGIAAFIAIGWAILAHKGFEKRIALPAPVVASFNRPARLDECFDKTDIATRADWHCRLGDASAAPSFLVLGDSHAYSLLDVFDEAARAQGVAGIFAGASGCPPLPGIHSLRDDQAEHDCHALNTRAYGWLADSGVQTVFLAARWTYYTDGDYAGEEFSYLGLTADAPRDLATSRQAFARGFTSSMARLQALGIQAVVVTQVPQQRFAPRNIFRRAWRKGYLDEARLVQLSVPRARHEELQQFVEGVFSATPGNLALLRTEQVFCDTQTCLAGDATGSFYFDDDHLSTHGARRLLPAISARLPSR
jgi:peptidoglycan/LPS O-acetylase OafA/YrhL